MLWFVPISEGACLVVLQVLVLCEIRQEHERRRGLSEFGGTQVWRCVSPVLNGGFAVVRIGRGLISMTRNAHGTPAHSNSPAWARR